MPNDHFVPRHYLRRFAFHGSELICAANVDPYEFLGKRGIGGQCCADEFYDKNDSLNKLLGATESDLAPLLITVTQNEDFNIQEINGLKFLGIALYLRTRKAVESAKVLPKFMAREVIESAVRLGKLPLPPEGEVTEDLFDFKHVAGVVMGSFIPCWIETLTLAAKLLKSENGSWFVTSDNPVVVLNQYCVGADKLRSYVGFSRSGFQLLMPMSPRLCLFIYDDHVYKVGGRSQRLVEITESDVEIVNSLQVQGAERRLYFHDPDLETGVKNLVNSYAGLRVPLRSTLQTLPGRTSDEQLLHLKNQSVRLPNRWDFCGYRRHIKSKPGDRRDPAWTDLADRVMKDLEQNPSEEGLFRRMERLSGNPIRPRLDSYQQGMALGGVKNL